MNLEDKSYVMNSYVDNWISCNVTGYPLPKVFWYTTVNSYGFNTNETLKVNLFMRLLSNYYDFMII